MKKILLVLVALGITTSLCAQEMSSEERKEAMKILEKKREEILERDKIRQKEMEEQRKLEEEQRAKEIEERRLAGEEVEEIIEADTMQTQQEKLAEEMRIKKEEERRLEEEMKNRTPMERLEATSKKAMDKLDFYERVVRSVEREENEIKSYEEIMKMD